MTEKEYRAHPAISRSSLFKILDSPEKFRYEQEHPEEPTPALRFGQAFHKMALQPEEFWDEFAVRPEMDRRTKAGKEEWAAFTEQNAGKTILSGEELETIQSMCSSLRKNVFASRLLQGAKEEPFFWTDELTGEACKCRTDCRTEIGGLPMIIDLKSTAKADTDSVMRDAINYGYDMQAAMYREGVQQSTGKEHGFVFIFVEKTPPYALNILQADALFFRRGYDLFRTAIGIYHDCKITGNWYGYLGRDQIINNLSLPVCLAKEFE